MRLWKIAFLVSTTAFITALLAIGCFIFALGGQHYLQESFDECVQHRLLLVELLPGKVRKDELLQLLHSKYPDWFYSMEEDGTLTLLGGPSFYFSPTGELQYFDFR